MSSARAGSAIAWLSDFELVVQRADAPAARDGFVEHAPAGHLLDVLTEVPDRQPLRHGHVALVWGFVARDHPEERGLPRPVRTHEPDLFTWVELERCVDEEHLTAVLLADSGERDHLPLWYPGRALGDGGGANGVHHEGTKTNGDARRRPMITVTNNTDDTEWFGWSHAGLAGVPDSERSADHKHGHDP